MAYIDPCIIVSGKLNRVGLALSKWNRKGGGDLNDAIKNTLQGI